MTKLLYTAITSLDGYVADEHGKFDWSEPDEQVHAFVNDLERPIGTYLLGRRMYEVLAVETRLCRRTSAWSSNSWTSTASPTGSCSFGTASGRIRDEPEDPPMPGA